MGNLNPHLRDVTDFQHKLWDQLHIMSKFNLDVGYSITKVDDDSYTFSVSTDTATTGNIRGGGGRATAGPVTIEK